MQFTNIYEECIDEKEIHEIIVNYIDCKLIHQGLIRPVSLSGKRLVVATQEFGSSLLSQVTKSLEI